MEAEERPSKIRKLSHDHTESFKCDDAQSLTSERNVLQPIDSTTTTADLGGFSNALEPASSKNDKTNDPVHEPESVENAENAEPPLSKNQLKKLRKKQEWEAGREYRKAKRRDKAKEKKARKRAEKHEHQDQLSTSLNPGSDNGQRSFGPRYRLPVTFVIDCGFDDLMMEKERISLGSQLTRAYSDNNRAHFQAHLYISSWGGELRKRFDGLMKGMYKNWKGVMVTEDDFVVAAKLADAEMRLGAKRRMVGAFQKFADCENGVPEKDGPEDRDGKTSQGDQGADTTVAIGKHHASSAESDLSFPVTDRDTKVDIDANGATDEHLEAPPCPGQRQDTQPPPESIQSSGSISRIVYLTSDSPNTLTELNPYHTYVVGGLVDKNRHKGICYKTACDRGVETAKLPIGDYMRMTSRFVLATNHVVEIMLKWLECGDWGEAFLQVMPKRKGAVLKTSIVDDAEQDFNEAAEAGNSSSELE